MSIFFLIFLLFSVLVSVHVSLSVQHRVTDCLEHAMLCFVIQFCNNSFVPFLTALEILVENRITGFPVIDQDWKLVSIHFCMPTHRGSHESKPNHCCCRLGLFQIMICWLWTPSLVNGPSNNHLSVFGFLCLQKYF